MVEVGNWRICSVVTSHYRLDGGAMFGVVPKVLWAKTQDVDDQNRIHMTTRTLLAVNRRAGRVLLADTGIGSKWSPEKTRRFGIQPVAGAIEQALHAVGTDAEDVTDVVITHLHFDHGGGMTEWVDEPDGPTRLCYPNARHWVHRRHWDHALQPNLRDRASFVPADFAILESAGVLAFVEGNANRCDIEDTEWVLSSGHTPCQILPTFLACGQGRDLLFAGDAIPTSAHLPLAWVMGYDLLPVTMLEERAEILRRCREQQLMLAFPHDLHCGIVSLRFDGDKAYVAETLG